jgi:hypothetical protein
MGLSPADNKTIDCQIQDERYVEALWRHAMRSDENVGVDFWWTDLCDLGTVLACTVLTYAVLTSSVI